MTAATFAAHCRRRGVDLPDELRADAELHSAGGAAYLLNLNGYNVGIAQHADDAPILWQPDGPARTIEQRACLRDICIRFGLDRVPDGAEAPVEPPPNAEPSRRFYRFDRLITGITSPRYLLYPILEENSLGVLYGDSMTFKTFVAIEMAVAVASGETLHGWTPDQGAVFILIGEGQGGIRRRLLAQAITKDTHSLPIYVCSVPAALIDAADTEAMAETIAEQAEADGVTPRFIIVDTMTRNMGGGDESSNADINLLLDNANRHLRERFWACVLLVHHVGHSDKTRTRGAYSLLGNVDFQIRAERQPNSDTITLFCAKTKDAPEWEPVAFEALPVTLPGLENPDGTPVTSLTLRRLDRVPEPPTIKGKQAAALDILRELTEAHRKTLEAEGHEPDNARVLRRDWQAALEDREVITDRRRFYELRDRLLGKRAIREEHGYVVLAG